MQWSFVKSNHAYLTHMFGQSPSKEERSLVHPLLGWKLFPAFSKPYPTAWQARLLPRQILVWETLPADHQYLLDLPALIMNRAVLGGLVSISPFNYFFTKTA